MYNCHTHIFTIKHVPKGFLPIYLRPIAKYIVKPWVVKLLRQIGLKSHSYLLKKFYNFKKIGELKTQADVFKHLQGFYPHQSGHVVLSMDMEFMGAGTVSDSFESQLNTLAELKEQHNNEILPFVFAHPERNDVAGIVKKYIEHHNFSGIKIYPALGYFPDDPKLDEVYKYAEDRQIPVMTHCTRGGVYYKGKLTKDRRTDRNGITYPKTKNAQFTDTYSDPDRYEKMLGKYPNLKICFAHFGGASEWGLFLQESWHGKMKESWFYKVKKIVCDERYNAYTDISYTLSDPKYFATLKAFLLAEPRLRERVLFGTDYYMTEQEVSERSFGINLRGFLGDELWEQIAITNPKKFLNL